MLLVARGRLSLVAAVSLLLREKHQEIGPGVASGSLPILLNAERNAFQLGPFKRDALTAASKDVKKTGEKTLTASGMYHGQAGVSVHRTIQLQYVREGTTELEGGIRGFGSVRAVNLIHARLH